MYSKLDPDYLRRSHEIRMMEQVFYFLGGEVTGDEVRDRVE